MKAIKTLLLLIGLAIPSLLSAQMPICDSIDNHDAGWYYQQPFNIIRLGDGSILTKTRLIKIDETGENLCYPYSSGGQLFYKIDPVGLVIVDSLLVEDPDPYCHLIAHLHPDTGLLQRYNNVRTGIICDEENSRSYLNLSFFDDNLVFCDDLEVTVPLTDTLVVSHHIPYGCWMLDSNNDIILQYGIVSRNETHFARFGLDGTLKCENTFPSSVVPSYDESSLSSPFNFQPHGLRQFSTSPDKYNYYGTDRSDLDIFKGYELDYGLNLVKTYEIQPSSTTSYPVVWTNGYNGMTTLDNGEFLLTMDSVCGQYETYFGVMKFDSEGSPVQRIWRKGFSTHGYYTANGSVDLQSDGNGHYYVSFYFVGVDWRNPKIAVFKLDENLNVIWERYGKDGWGLTATRMMLLEEGGVAVLGFNFLYKLHTGMFLMFYDENGVGVTETDDTFRPYVFFPNPVDDRLFVHYSPDVSPRRAELYDMQGRLVGAQEGSLESVGMGHLPPGTYTLRILMNDGASFSDKVVKQ